MYQHPQLTILEESTPKERVMINVDRSSSLESLKDYSREVTWLFFRDNHWTPFQSNNHFKIEQSFTLGGNTKAQTFYIFYLLSIKRYLCRYKR
jgi:hypothetical protein